MYDKGFQQPVISQCREIVEIPVFRFPQSIQHSKGQQTEKKMDGISQTTFTNAFSWMEMYEFRLKFHWTLFLRF